jgi:hypothetical protein
LIAWGEQSTPAPFLEAAARGWLEFHLPKPTWSPDEQFHRVITGSLEEWWRERGGRFDTVTVIGDDPSARIHEIRDLLARNSIPFGFYPSDSPEGQAALRRLDVTEHARPVLSLYTGAVLVDPTNAEVAKTLGLTGRLPAAVMTLEEQARRAWQQLQRQPTDLAKNVYLEQLHDRIEVLYYKVLGDHLPELLPVVYDPTVGEAIEKYSGEYRRPRGIFLSIDQPDDIEKAFGTLQLGPEDVDLIVCSDAEEILGIGDWG